MKQDDHFPATLRLSNRSRPNTTAVIWVSLCLFRALSPHCLSLCVVSRTCVR